MPADNGYPSILGSMVRGLARSDCVSLYSHSIITVVRVLYAAVVDMIFECVHTYLLIVACIVARCVVCT
jgi:hypothetical protein